MSAAVKPIPEGMHSLTPHLIRNGAAAAIAFYRDAFGAVETSRLPGPDGKLVHASIRLGDSTPMLADEIAGCGVAGPRRLAGSPVMLHLYVEDADAVMACADDARHRNVPGRPLRSARGAVWPSLAGRHAPA